MGESGRLRVTLHSNIVFYNQNIVVVGVRSRTGIFRDKLCVDSQRIVNWTYPKLVERPVQNCLSAKLKSCRNYVLKIFFSWRLACFFQICRRNQHQNRSVTSAEMDLFHSEIRRKPGQALEPVSRKYRALDGFGHLGNWNLCVKHVPLSWFCWKLDWCTFEAKPHYFSQWSPLKGPEILSTWPILSHFKSMISSRWWIWEGVKKEAEYHNFTYSWSRPMFTWWINLRDTLDLNVWDVDPTRLFNGRSSWDLSCFAETDRIYHFHFFFWGTAPRCRQHTWAINLHDMVHILMLYISNIKAILHFYSFKFTAYQADRSSNLPWKKLQGNCPWTTAPNAFSHEQCTKPARSFNYPR